jgi:hypothetical protein
VVASWSVYIPSCGVHDARSSKRWPNVLETAGCPEGDTVSSRRWNLRKQMRPRRSTLEGSYSSLEEIVFVEFDPGVGQQFPVFLFERRLPVVFLLTLNVLDEAWQILLRTCERSVPFLPVGKPLEDPVLFDPAGRARLNVFNQIGQADGRMQAGENMQVILYPVNAVKVPITVLNNSPDVAEQVRAAVRGEEDRGAVLGGKDNVISDGREGRHPTIIAGSTPCGVVGLSCVRFP